MKKTLLLFASISSLLVLPLFISGCGNHGARTAQIHDARAELIAGFHGKIHDVKMIGDEMHPYRYVPSTIKIKAGDMVRFTMAADGVHDVSFKNQTLPSGATMLMEHDGELASPLLQVHGQNWDVYFPADMPAGEYNFICTPHVALGMRGKVIVTK